MAAVEYNFYTTTYKGSSIPTAEWNFVEARVHEILDRYERMWTVEEVVTNGKQLAICAMADSYYYFMAASNGEIATSSSIGSVSSSSVNKVDVSVEAQAKELRRCAETYLDIYRGVTKC